MSNWNQLANDQTIETTIKALKENGIEAQVVETAKDAKDKVIEIIPEGSEVMTMSSVSLEDTGITQLINESGKYDSVKKKLFSMDPKKEKVDMQKVGAAPEYALGSVHAVTSDGKLVIASNTGSQLGAYAYASKHVIWIVGTQKIVKNIEDGIKRLEEYVVPKEDVHMQKLYGVHTNIDRKSVV